MHKPPRVKIPARARERVHRAAHAFASAAADTMIANLEKVLSDELAAAMQRPAARPALDMDEGPAEVLRP